MPELDLKQAKTVAKAVGKEARLSIVEAGVSGIAAFSSLLTFGAQAAAKMSQRGTIRAISATQDLMEKNQGTTDTMAAMAQASERAQAKAAPAPKSSAKNKTPEPGTSNQ
jgi:hypothetical protein